MSDGEAALLLGYSDLSAGGNWASKRCAKKVDILIDGITRDSGEAELLNELWLISMYDDVGDVVRVTSFRKSST